MEQAWKFTVLQHNVTEQNLFISISHIAVLAVIRLRLGINTHAK
jgi:hypothetical protein